MRRHALAASVSRRTALAAGTLALAARPWRAWGAERAEFRLSVGTLAPRGSSFHQAFQKMGDEWKRLSGGRVELVIYPGTQGGEATMVRRMGVNQLQGAMLTAAGMGVIDPSATALQLIPMAFQSWAEVDHVREKLRKELEAQFNAKGYEVLFWGDAGWVRWFSRRPLRTPADLKAMKVFALSGDQQAIEIMRDYYQPVVLEADKIYTGLSTGLIEAVSLPAFLANFTQIATVAPHMLDLKYAPVVGSMIITRRAWEKIPADLQQQLRAAGEQAGEAIRQQSRAEDDAAIQAMRDKQGLQVTASTPELVQEWAGVIRNAWPRIRGTLVPAELFDRVLKELEAFRSRPAAG
ncbi:MAG: TRAP transporter substrate-binding protein DctP [Limisphaerales bacterium]